MIALLIAGLYILSLVGGASLLNQGVAYSQEATKSLAQPEKTEVITIILESYSFTPQSFTVKKGEFVQLVLKNESFLVPHNFLLDSPDGIRLIEVNVDSGEQTSVQFTPTESGVYAFYCDKQLLFFPNHREEGMEGSLTVQ